MLWLAAGFCMVVVCTIGALAVAAVDEFRRPASNLRRTGALLALVASFASFWLLLSPLSAPAGCPASLMVLSDGGVPAACEAGWPNAIAGLGAAVVAAGAVLVTRNRT